MYVLDFVRRIVFGQCVALKRYFYVNIFVETSPTRKKQNKIFSR